MPDGPQEVKDELRDSMAFVVNVLVFGAAIFAVLFNLCYLAVQNDLRLQRAYLVIAHSKGRSAGEVESAIRALDQMLAEDARDGGRPILCEQDYDLIQLYPSLKGAPKEMLAELLARKTGRDSGWEELYIEHLPTSRSPFQMPFLELNLLYYGWLIEIATIIFLSQSLRKPHVQESLYRATMNPLYFLPVVTLLLFVPAWNWVSLLYPRNAGQGAAVLVAFCCLLGAWLGFKVARVQLSSAKMNEMGFHLLISSLFVQLLTVMGDLDVAYTVFSAQRMDTLRYVTWFIMLCYPGLLLQKWYQGTRGGPTS